MCSDADRHGRKARDKRAGVHPRAMQRDAASFPLHWNASAKRVRLLGQDARTHRAVVHPSRPAALRRHTGLEKMVVLHTLSQHVERRHGINSRCRHDLVENVLPHLRCPQFLKIIGILDIDLARNVIVTITMIEH